MRPRLAILLALFLISCGTVAPRDSIDPNQWVHHDHKTDYFARDTGENAAYLTVKYGSYTFTDKSAEMVSVAKTVFIQIAEELSRKRGQRFAVVNPSTFYESVAYNGVTGVSTVLVSNDVRFVLTQATANGAPRQDAGDLPSRLEQLEKAFEAGLITKQEYEEKRQELLKQF